MVKKILAIVLVSGLMTGMGLMAIFIGMQEIIGAYSSKGWPSVMGTVIRSKVLVSKSSTSSSGQLSRTETSYTPDVAYRYVVDGTTIKNDNIRYGLATNKYISENLVKQYPVGKEVKIFYNPGNPKQSVLQPGYFGGLLLMPILGLLATSAGLFVGFLFWKFGEQM